MTQIEGNENQLIFAFPDREVNCTTSTEALTSRLLERADISIIDFFLCFNQGGTTASSPSGKYLILISLPGKNLLSRIFHTPYCLSGLASSIYESSFKGMGSLLRIP